METPMQELNKMRCNLPTDEFIKWLYVDMKELLEKEKQTIIEAWVGGWNEKTNKDEMDYSQDESGEKYYNNKFKK